MDSVVDRYFVFVIQDAVEKWQPRWHCGWSAAALSAILLVIGNVEQNGPPSESAFLNSSCRDGAVRDLECFTADGASQDASTVRRSGRERRPTERAAAVLFGDVAVFLNDDGDGARRVRRRPDLAAAFLDNAADDPDDGDGECALQFEARHKTPHFKWLQLNTDCEADIGQLLAVAQNPHNRSWVRTRRASNATAQRSHGGRRLLSVRTCSDCHQSKATRSSFDTGCSPDFLQCILNVPFEQMASLSLLTPVMSFSAAAACRRYVSGAQACMCCCRLLSLVWLPHHCSKALPSTSTSPRNLHVTAKCSPLPGLHAPYFSRTSYTLLGAHYITAFPNQ